MADVLVVASKVKAYVKEKTELRTSAEVIDRLSAEVASMLDEAAVKAKAANRKTLMVEDFSG
jgi:histone H3/H4